ncbi:MAG: hypothetical protein AB8C95_05685 [Phycisphaeraceae bacterium]
MPKPIALILIVFMFCSLHAEAEEKEQEAVPIVGIWLLSDMQVNGKAVEDDDIGNRIFTFADDGTMQAFENVEDYGNEKADDKGWYELDDEGNVSFYEDLNRDDKLDDDEKEKPDVLAWAFEDGTLTLSKTIRAGDKKMTFAVILKPYQPED